jgi:hydroxypyruvate isomerase
MERRVFVAAAVVGAVGAAGVTASGAGLQPGRENVPGGPWPQHERGFKHSVCRWCFGGMPLKDLCINARAMGISSVELLDPSDWATTAEHGLVCAVANSVKANPISKGFNRVEHHDEIIGQLEERLPMVKRAGIPNQIVFSGNRAGLSDQEGLRHCATGLKRIVPTAERLGVTIVMELLNSKIDHADYQCDRTAWGVELVKRVGSERFKLLYDIYHMQIMEGDVIRTITDHHEMIGHYHTAGNPGRHEIDENQELNYRAIARAIKATGFTGYVAQEFLPQRDAMESLRRAVEICSV